MGLVDILLLLALSAIWGSSFMFMRYLAPRIGPVATADARLLIAGLVLVALFALLRFDLRWRERWRRYLVIGLLNSGLPFLLYSFASLSLPSSVEVVINALSPGFAALFGVVWLGERLTARKILGLLLGIGGVVVVSGLGRRGAGGAALLPVLACVGATICYGLAGVYIKLRARDIEPKAMAGASQLLAGLALLPILGLVPPPGPPDPRTGLVVLAFAVLCSALAYLIYYRLIAAVGPSRALTVTFLMPVFGFLWGALFLGEAIGASMLAGAALILGGTFLVAGPSWPKRGGRDPAGRRVGPGEGVSSPPLQSRLWRGSIGAMAKVLVVDDEPSIRVLISEILERKGYEVFMAANADEAVGIAVREKPEVAIVDLVMPGMGGMTLIMEKLRDVPGLNIVAMSGRIPLGNDAFTSFSEQFGVACFLQKPFTVQELLAAMGHARDGACV